MPTPLGHAIGGVAAGWLVGTSPQSRGSVPTPTRAARPSGLLGLALDPTVVRWALLGMLPDVDLLFGLHSRHTHSLGAVVLVVTAALWWHRPAIRPAVAMAAAYGSHLLLDWLGNDTSPPIGIMALWPFSGEFFQSDLHVFGAVSRRYWLAEFWVGNLVVVARELAILLPLALVARTVDRWRARRADAFLNGQSSAA